MLPEIVITAPAPCPPLPSAAEVALARESSRLLSSLLQPHGEIHQIELRDGQGVASAVRVPAMALRLLLDALTEIGAGNAVSVAPIRAELTTQEAADALGVSRPYLVRLLERGGIPFHKVGTHRRVRHQDLMAYKARLDAQRCKALDELAAQAQELGLYD